MLKSIKTLISLFITASVMACPFQIESQNLCIDIEWTNGPFDGKLSTFEAIVYDKDSGDRVSPEDLKVYVWMIMANGHQHGGPATSWSFSENQVINGSAKFFMGHMKGYWQVRFELDGDITAIPVELSK